MVSLCFFGDRKFGLLSSKPPELLIDLLWNIGFYGHIIPGGIALLIGWIQFVPNIRKKRISLHRSLGKLYIALVLISGVCSIYIAFFATGGLVAKIGFLSLGLFWLITTVISLNAIKSGDITRHQKMMVYSYAACFSAVTLRIWLPILIGIFDDFIPAYWIVAYLAWIPNLAVAYLINKKNTIPVVV